MKYSEQDILSRKRELQRLTTRIDEKHSELEKIDREKEIKKKEVEKIRLEIRSLGDSFAENKKKHEDNLKYLLNYANRLSKTIEILKNAKKSLSYSIPKRKESDPGVTFTRSVIFHLRDELDAIDSKKSSEEEQLEKLEKRRQEYEHSLELYEQERQSAEQRLDDLHREIEESEGYREDLNKEYEKTKKKIDTIEKREKDCKVMLRRLSDDYQKVYQQVPHTKKEALNK